MNSIYARFYQRVATKEQWVDLEQALPEAAILGQGEFGIELDLTTGKFKFKIGTGNKKWSELPYNDSLPDLFEPTYNKMDSTSQEDIIAYSLRCGNATVIRRQMDNDSNHKE